MRGAMEASMPPSSPGKAPLPSLGGTLGFGDVTIVEGLDVKQKEEPFCVICNKKFVSRELFDGRLSGKTYKEALKKKVQPGLFGCGALYEHIYKTLEPIQLRDKVE